MITDRRLVPKRLRWPADQNRTMLDGLILNRNRGRPFLLLRQYCGLAHMISIASEIAMNDASHLGDFKAPVCFRFLGVRNDDVRKFGRAIHLELLELRHLFKDSRSRDFSLSRFRHGAVGTHIRYNLGSNLGSRPCCNWWCCWWCSK